MVVSVPVPARVYGRHETVIALRGPMKRTVRIVAAAATLAAPLMMALPHQSQPVFEVATVRPYKDDATAGGMVMIGGGCRGFDSPAPGTAGPGAGGP